MLAKGAAACSGITLLVAGGIWLALASCAGAKGHGVGVAPKYGTRSTKFTVSFTAPDRSGVTATMDRRYEVSATGPAGAKGCVDSATRLGYSPRARARVRVILNPKAFGRGWCTGSFSGTVTEITGPVCPKGEICPAFAVLVRTLGRFKFHVRPAAGGVDRTPPRFGGLVSATACTPGPQRPGQTTPFTLRWNAARDDVTLSAKIVYDVFESSTAGGENFSRPSWTTAAGATTFRTPGLPSHGTFYFVVRARDRAGNVDRNRVERRGLDPCF